MMILNSQTSLLMCINYQMYQMTYNNCYEVCTLLALCWSLVLACAYCSLVSGPILLMYMNGLASLMLLVVTNNFCKVCNTPEMYWDHPSSGSDRFLVLQKFWLLLLLDMTWLTSWMVYINYQKSQTLMSMSYKVCTILPMCCDLQWTWSDWFLV